VDDLESDPERPKSAGEVRTVHDSKVKESASVMRVKDDPVFTVRDELRQQPDKTSWSTRTCRAALYTPAHSVFRVATEASSALLELLGRDVAQACSGSIRGSGQDRPQG